MPSIGIALSQSTSQEFDVAIRHLATLQQKGAVVLDLRKGDEQGRPIGVVDVGTSPIRFPGTVEIFTDHAKASAREGELRQAAKIVRMILARAPKVIDARVNPPTPLAPNQDILYLVHYND